MMRSRSLAVVIWAALVALTGLVHAARAENALERLVSPGDVIKGHAKTEKDCNSCHKPFSPSAQDGLCLDCHKKIAADRDAKEGFHWLSLEARTQRCSHCHSDHKGRDFDSIQLDKTAFDHSKTDYPLSGAHITVACDSCHKPDKLYRDAPSACVSCHKSEDRHAGALGDKCETCHEASAWTKVKPFDHDRTKFKLTGAHNKTACASCHAGEHWKGVSGVCVDCHRAQDTHHGTYGAKCEACHSTKTWSTIGFDHDKDTKFPLLAKHISTPCNKCHTKDPKLEKLGTTCIACHKKEDVHKGRLGKECQTCHNESGWKIGVLFDHDKDSKFPLFGKHATAKCDTCHQKKDYGDVPRTCVGCHAKKDVHEGRLGPKCEACHGAKDWKTWSYDHGVRARYPLTGKHAKTACKDCHVEKHVEKVVTPRDCDSCHAKDDKHHGAFGKDCGKCHTASAFKPARIGN